MKATIQLLILASVNSILFSPIESKAVSPFCNPTGDKPKYLGLLFEKKDSFILKSGESVELFTRIQRGLVRSIVLSIHDYKVNENKDKNIYEIKIKYIEEYPKCYVIESTNVYISRFGDYTLNPQSMSAKFERPGLRGYRGYIGIEGIVLELLDLTENGVAKVRLENKQDK